MNTPQNNTDNNTPSATTGSPTPARPFGLWLKIIDRRLTELLDEQYSEFGIGRREWRRLNVIGRGVGGEQMLARLAARPEKVEPLIERGLVAGETGAWSLTTEGERVYNAMLEKVGAVRGKVTGAASPEDFATTLATLESIARELGWNEEERTHRGHGHGGPRGHRGRRGHSPREGREGCEGREGRSPREGRASHEGREARENHSRRRHDAN